MKFYLTKQAQLAAEGRGPASVKAAKSPKAAKGTKAPKGIRRSTADVPLVPAPSAAATSLVAAPQSAGEASPPKQPKPNRGIIAIGGLPRVDLLPPEVRAERRAAVHVRRAWTAVAGLAILVVVAGGTAALYAQGSEATLASAQNQTSFLASQTMKYSAVKTTQGQVDLIDAARKVGGSTDINWPAYLAKVQATLPSGMTLATVTIDSASPVASYAQATTPLEGQRVATLTFSATSTSLPSVPTWLTKLATLPGYTDAQAGTIQLQTGVYTAGVVVHIDEKAFSDAYTKEGK